MASGRLLLLDLNQGGRCVKLTISVALRYILRDSVLLRWLDPLRLQIPGLDSVISDLAHWLKAFFSALTHDILRRDDLRVVFSTFGVRARHIANPEHHASRLPMRMDPFYLGQIQHLGEALAVASDMVPIAFKCR